MTEKTAIKYFGVDWQSRPDVLGSTFTLNGSNNFIVAGVLADTPSYSSIQFDFLISFEHVVKNDRWGYQWGSHNFHTYIELSPAANITEFKNLIKGELKRYYKESGFDLDLQPLTDIYLSSIPGYDWGKHGQKQYVIIFGVVAALILAIACFNYINLSTARPRKRAREVGVRKIIGAGKRQLFFQFMGEATLIVFASALLSRGLIDLLLPVFNTLSGKQLIVSEFQTELTLFMIIVAVVTSTLSGVYPAIFLSSFSPINVLSGSVPARSGKQFRSVSVTTQFAVSMTLIACTLIAYDQLAYIQSKDIGFDKADLVYVRLGGELRKNSEPFKNELIKASSIGSVARSTSTLVNTDNGSYIEWPAKPSNEEVTISQINVDEDFISLMDIKLVSGHNFLHGDSTSYILNEAAVKAMGLTPDNALGLKVKFWGTEGTVIGVAKDFHFRPLHHKIMPLIIRHALQENYFTMLFRIEKSAMPDFTAQVERTYRKYAGDYPFQFGYVDDMIELQYQNERRVGKIILLFSSLSIFISMLGMFGLISYSVEVRTKEFSIRKVLGSSQTHIFGLLSKQFVLLVVIAFAIAGPMAWWLSNHWLENFSYQVSISPTAFVITLLLVGAVSAIMIFLQATIAARKSPADVLKAID